MTIAISDTSEASVYIVSPQTFEADVQSLRHGGYFAHKFAFGFREIARRQMDFDPPACFWSFEYARLTAKGHRPASGEDLARFVQREIYQFCPTVGRSLAVFLDDLTRRKCLIQYLDRLIQDTTTKIALEVNPLLFADAQQRAYFRFCRDYGNFKDVGARWGVRAITKLIYSLNAVDHSRIQEYLCTDPICRNGQSLDV